MNFLVARPSAPKGPLQVYDVMEESCTLKWHYPEDDGGMKVSHYLVEKRDLTRGDWSIVQEIGELTISVGRLQAKHQYHFRVKAINKIGTSDPLQTKDATLAKNPYGMQVLIFVL